MPTVTVSQAFAMALQHHESGRLMEAEALYRQVLATEPRHAGALHHIGVLAHQKGRLDLAEGWIRQSVAIAPQNVMAHCDLGEVLRAMGRMDEAIVSYRAALQGDPQCAEAHANLGLALSALGQCNEALGAFRRALELKPDHGIFHYNLGNLLRKRDEVKEAALHLQRAVELRPDFAPAWNNLGNVLVQGGHSDEAIARFRRAVELRPDYAVAWFNLGNTFAAQGKFDEAVAAFREAARFKPELPDIWNNLGGALLENERPDEATAAFRQAIQIKPDLAEAYSNLGKALGRVRRFDEAMAACQQALALRPDLSTTWIDLGNALKKAGRLDEAIAAFRSAAKSNPSDPVPYSNTIYTLHFHPQGDAGTIATEQGHWNERFGRPPGILASHNNDPLPGRRLRIGYVSPEFRDHVTGRYLVPLFENHDRENFEILCYSGVIHPDFRTDEFRRMADQWRETKGVTDEAMAGMIRDDQIDILVDLTQHLADNRLPVFAYRPAPVQMSFAGYPESTGIEAIGCRVSDCYLETSIDGAVETPEQVFLIDTFWCYDPCGMNGGISSSAVPLEGPIRFGCLNNFCKTNEPVLKLWARLLREVQPSLLVMLSPEGQCRQRVLELMKQEGVDPGRLRFVEMRERAAYLDLYNHFDIALDPFPYNGHTTTLDALWMGVPVVTMVGRSAVSRAGLTQLANLGLEEFAAWSEEDYLRIARDLAADRPRLAVLRRTLRARMEASSLMNAARFTRQIEAAYRVGWRRWCAAKLAAPPPTR